MPAAAEAAWKKEKKAAASGFTASIKSTGRAALSTIKTGIDLLGFNGQERMMKAADKTAETVKSTGYAIFHPRKTAEEAVKAIKSAAKEKGGSYIGGYVLGEAAQVATLTVAGSTGKSETKKISKTNTKTSKEISSGSSATYAYSKASKRIKSNIWTISKNSYIVYE